jgi:N utilization substance protein B
MTAIRRSRAREVVLQVLYQDDLNARVNPAEGDEFLRRRVRTSPMLQFARELLGGVRRNRQEIDKKIEEAAQNWSLGRMAPTDRNVLRIGTFELMHTDTPTPIVIDEAVELAKRYGSAQSSSFVNGILDRLAKTRIIVAESLRDS